MYSANANVTNFYFIRSIIYFKTCSDKFTYILSSHDTTKCQNMFHHLRTILILR